MKRYFILGGGVAIFSCPGSVKGREYRDAIYDAVIAAGDLRGDRASPKQEKAYDALKLTKAPAVLVEYGFMDSKTDVPVILTEEYAKAVGYATMDAIAAVAGLQKNPQLYRVQVGAFSDRKNAENLLESMENMGFTGLIVEVTKDGR